MSSPSCADHDGYDTPSQQREDSTTLMPPTSSCSDIGALFSEDYIVLSKVDAVAKVSQEIHVVNDNIASVEKEVKNIEGQISSV